MIAKSFRPVAWVAAIGAAALSCYMLSLRVASERADLAGLERRIVSTRQDIRQLQTELGTRGRLQQLEEWNADVLALSAPASGQFLDSGVSLARFDTRQPSVDARAAEVRMAAAETPPPAATVERPVTLASAEAPRAAPLAPAQPLVRRASLTTADAIPAAARTSAPDRPRALLDDGTLRDLGREARAERGGAHN